MRGVGWQVGGWAAEDWVTGQHGVVQREREGETEGERGGVEAL